MFRLRPLILLAACWLLAPAALAHANSLAQGRVVSVLPAAVNGGCVVGPNGGSVQFWEVQPGKSYEITIDHVTDCANNGTDATIGIRINSSSVGNTDLVAEKVVDGTYKFTFTIPVGARCTMPLFYCTTPGDGASGLRLRRDNGDDFQAHLRMASFAPDCTVLAALNGGDCLATPTVSRTWSQVKQIYR